MTEQPDIETITVPRAGVAVEAFIDCEDGILRVPLKFDSLTSAADGLITLAARMRRLHGEITGG
jgi:hypothetical protein